MFETIRPLHDRVYIERVEQQEKTSGGIFIPDAAKEKAQLGKVLSTGQGRRDANGNLITMAVKVGDIVYFGKYAGTETDEKHLILREDEIFGIVEK